MVQYSAEMGRVVVLLGLLVVAPGLAFAEDPVAEARQRYNEGAFDAAVALASAAWEESGSTSAAVVLARSRLERFRVSGNREDLEAADDLLRELDPGTLSTAERSEWELGVAASLYLHEDYGPAAEILDRLLREGNVPTADRDRLIDWWASAVDRAAHRLGREERIRTYERLAQRLELEAARHAGSAAAAYWLVEAVRGVGDLERAWSLCVANWIRSSRGDALLRSDLDRLMLQGVIPDLAVSRTALPAGNPTTVAVMAQLASDWEEIKARWEDR